ncbi:MAG TPA: hypothetical protein VFI48_11685 [Hyphomicrobiaceae bacterium]|nr:hypothetical protein [Hyphomicrobiaceae bacterium]
MDIQATLDVAQAVGLRQPKVIPWKLKPNGRAHALTWGPDTARWSLLIPPDASLDQLKALFCGVANYDPQMGTEPAPPAPTPDPPATENGLMLGRVMFRDAPEPVEARPHRAWSLKDAMAAADSEPTRQAPQPAPEIIPGQAAEMAPPVFDRVMQRRQARARVESEIMDYLRASFDDLQVRYEAAMYAMNGNTYYIEQFEPEARALGVKVEELCQGIIEQRRVRERRIQAIATAKAFAFKQMEVDDADIDAVAQEAIRVIRGE